LGVTVVKWFLGWGAGGGLGGGHGEGVAWKGQEEEVSDACGHCGAGLQGGRPWHGVYVPSTNFESFHKNTEIAKI